MEESTTRELFDQLQSRLVLNLEENEIPCPKCKGLKFYLVEEGENKYISSCNHCHTGKLFVCKHCKKGSKSWCNCKEAQEERNNNFRLGQSKKELENYNKAKKISYLDYDGKYSLPNREHVQDQEGLAEWIEEELLDGNDIPDYLWAVDKNLCFSIILSDTILDGCEDGYDEMYSYLNTDSPLLTQAQELIDQWEKEQGDHLYTYDETHKTAVIIKDLVDKIREEIESSKS